METLISLKEAARYWLKLGLTGFGGPAGQIAMMHKEVVDKRKWMDEDHFLQALNFCMLLPGPEAQQLATYIGWRMHGKWGGLVSGGLFVLPSVFILWLLSWLYASMGNVPAVTALFYGLKPAVVAIVAEAVLRIGKKSLKSAALVSLAALSFVCIYFLHVPFPAIVLAAGVIGYAGGVLNIKAFIVTKPLVCAPSGPSCALNTPARHDWGGTLRIAAICLFVWLAPLPVIGAMKGWDSIFFGIGVLFSKAALVTFGGAYAVLAYIGQQAVNHYGWIQPEQMMDGLGLAETTPGPLIMVNQFVGYVAAYSHPEGLGQGTAGMLGGLLATWVTFSPSFLFIFIFAPFIERLRGNIKLGAALSAITASVVGVVLNLSVNFTHHALLPDAGGFDWFTLAASIIAFAGMQYRKWPMIPVIACSAVIGLLWKTI